MSATLLKRRSGGVAAQRADRAGAPSLPRPQERQRHRRASAPGRHPLAAAHHRPDRGRHQGPHAGLGVELDATIRGADGDKKALAGKVGALLAERAKAAGISKVVFDRGGNRYAGRIAALADAAREAGLEF